MRVHALAGLLAASLLAGPLGAQEGPYFRVEYWECPAENVEAFASAVDSIWGPIFDELTEEGRFVSWHAQTPVRAVDLEFVGGEEMSEEVPPPWQVVGVWAAESREAMDAAWEEFLARLRDRYPEDPRPTRFCGDLLVVDYRERRGS